LANYWKHCGDSAPGGSVFRAAKTAWLPCALASGTTAIGLASLLASNLVPVRDFGIYSAIGCIISFVIVLYVLPSLMLYWPKSPPPAEELETENWNRFGVWIARNRHLVSASCVLATVAAGWGLRHFDTETKVIRYFPTESRLVQDYVFLEDKLSGVISIDTIVKFDQQARQKLPFIDRARLVRDLQQDVRQHPEISGVLSLASFLDLREADTED
ncbi:MAG: MMPL family transporter, partial [Fuerstiella sp.]|nr:MMPL family transporter [Fuerstiella sp.]